MKKQDLYMKKIKKEKLKGVIVRFELLDEETNIINIIAEQTFPNAIFKHWTELRNPYLTPYYCFDKDVREYVRKQHRINDLQFNYEDWENAPNVRQAFYNTDNDLIYTVDEVAYGMYTEN